MIARLLAFGDDRAVAGRREEAADAGAAGADPLGERALRHQLDLELAARGTAARIPCSRRRRSRSSSGPAARCSRMPMPKSSTPALLLMTVRSLRAARVQRRDQVLGNAAEAEAAHHDRGAVGTSATAASALGQDFVHEGIIPAATVPRCWASRVQGAYAVTVPKDRPSGAVKDGGHGRKVRRRSRRQAALASRCEIALQPFA